MLGTKGKGVTFKNIGCQNPSKISGKVVQEVCWIKKRKVITFEKTCSFIKGELKFEIDEPTTVKRPDELNKLDEKFGHLLKTGLLLS